MEKPVSMPVKDFIIRQMAVKMMMSEKTLDAVVMHQFWSANEAMQTNYSVEISGFGKFYFNHKKALKRMEKMISKVKGFHRIANDENNSLARRISANNKLVNTLAQIRELKPRIDEHLFPDLRGLEEQFAPSQEIEAANQSSEQREDGHLREMHLPLRGEEEKAGV